MQMNEIMTRQPTFLQMDQPIFEAAAMMRDEDVGFLPVCDAERKVIGMITDRDITLRIVASQRTSDTPVRDVMSADIVSCKLTDEVHHAEALMRDHQISRLVCLDGDGKLAGVVGLADLAKKDDDAHTSAVVREVKASAESNAPAH